MKDFKQKNLYDNEMGLFQAVIEQRVETMSEYNRVGRYRVGNEEEDEDTKLLGSAFDTDDFGADGGWGDFGLGGSDFGTFGGYDSGVGSEKERSLPKGEWDNLRPNYVKVLMSPIWAMSYFFRGLLYDNPFKNPNKKEEASDSTNDLGGLGSDNSTGVNQHNSDILKGFTLAGLVMGVLALLQLTGYVRVLLVPNIGIFSIILAVLIDGLNHHYYKKGIMTDFIQGDELDEFESDEGDADGADEFGGLEQDTGVGGSDDLFSGFSGFGDYQEEDLGESLSDRYAEYEDEFEDEEDDIDYEEQEGNRISRLFPTSPVNTRGDDADFDNTLLDVFKDGNRNKGKMYRKRSDILKTFAPYLPSNDDSFAKWYDIKEHSPEYDNIAFTLYKALVQINNKFAIENGSKDKLTVFSMKRTPLIYKIEVKLPSYFKESQVMGATKQINNYLKKSDDDLDVGSLVSTFNGNYIFKFLRLDARGLISYGDIARYENPETGEAPVDDLTKDKGIPILLGLRDNEYPFTFDLEANTSGVIVGGSGSGKSWLTFQLMMSMLTTNTPEELNFLVLDAKNAAIWKQFAKAPHVIGYHTDIYTYIELLNEINAEHLRRQDLLSEHGVEDFKTLREDLKAQGDYETLSKNPFLVVVVDEITYTMTTLRDHDKELYDSLKAILSSLSAVVRSSGIRLLLIGQRSIDTSIPKSVMANSSMKFGMKMNAMSDYGPMFGDDYKKVSRIPTSAGEGLISLEGMANLEYLKTLVPGGTSTPQLMRVIRVVSLDWVRRTIGTGKDYYRLPGGMNDTIKSGFNRDRYYADSLGDLRDGRILRNQQVNEGYQVNIEEGVSGDTSSKYGLSEQSVIFGEDTPTHYSEELDNDLIMQQDEISQDFDAITQDSSDSDIEEFNSEFEIGNDIFEGFELVIEDSNDLVIEDSNDLVIEDTNDLVIEEPNELDIEEPNNLVIEEPNALNTNASDDSQKSKQDFEQTKEPNIKKGRPLPRGLMGVGEVRIPSLFSQTESNKDESKQDESKQDESKQDESKQDESKQDESKQDESKQDESKQDESKQDESKQDESKQDESNAQAKFSEVPSDELSIGDLLEMDDDTVQPTLNDNPNDTKDEQHTETDKELQEQIKRQLEQQLEEQRLELERELREERERIERERQEIEKAQQEQQERYRQLKEDMLKQQQELSKANVQKQEKKKPKDEVKKTESKALPKKEQEDERGYEVKLGIKQYIVKHGTRVDFHTRAVPKEVIQSKYTKREIKVAQQVGQIYATEDAYVASIN